MGGEEFNQLLPVFLLQESRYRSFGERSEGLVRGGKYGEVVVAFESRSEPGYLRGGEQGGKCPGSLCR